MDRLVRVLSYNIHKGFSAGNRRFVLSAMRDAIVDIDPDIVFLQEVLGEHRGHAARVSSWPDLAQYDFLAGESWSHVAYGPNRHHRHGHHGNALLSRFPLVGWANTNISTNRLEQRGVLHARVRPEAFKTPLHCLCVHLNMVGAGKHRQLNDVTELVLREIPASEPLILAGDFNDWSQRASRKLIEGLGAIEAFKSGQGSYARTFPSWYPLFPLDRIYLRGFEVVCTKVLNGDPWRKLSDHAALYAELRISSSSVASSLDECGDAVAKDRE